MSSILLNAGQRKAMEHAGGPMMVLAGPGSGKTTVITYRIRHLMEANRIAPDQILVISFTKLATEEMRRRFLSFCPEGREVTFATFHALFFKILRSVSGIGLDNIIKDEDRKEAVRLILQQTGRQRDEEFLRTVLNEISLVKNELIVPEAHHSTYMSDCDFLHVYQSYEKYKDEKQKIDFDDMLIRCHTLLQNNESVLKRWRERYKYILIDEFQDINNAQYRSIQMLSAPEHNLFVVGDDDQSIYKFRGAKPEFLLRFPQDYPGVQTAVLDVNYRSTDQVIRLCNHVIAPNKVRYTKSITGTSRDGPKPVILRPPDVNGEARLIAGKIKDMTKEGRALTQIAVIYRTNMQARAFVDAFMNLRIPYQVRDEMPGIYEHWISKDIYAYFRLSLDRSDDGSLRRIINKPARYISKAALQPATKADGGLLSRLYSGHMLQTWQLAKLEELMFYLNSLSNRSAYEAIRYLRHAVGYDEYLKEYADYFKADLSGLREVVEELQEAAKAYDNLPLYLQHVDEAIAEGKAKKGRRDWQTQEGVLLTTMHSAKGLEFEVVFVAGAVEGVIPHEKSKTEAEIEEERRLLYVALTRAKTELYVSMMQTRYELDAQPTRFMYNTHQKNHREK